MKIKYLLFIIFLGLMSSCSKGKITASKEKWGTTNNQDIYLYTLSNANNMSIKLTNYGAIITSILVPNRNNEIDDVVLGFDNLEQYLKPNPCFGATIGRFANRIRDGKFTIDGIEYQLAQNDKTHCTHGDNEFDRTIWNSEIVNNEFGTGVKFSRLSEDKSKGFPGNLEVTVTYTLTEDSAMRIDFEGITDKATHVNLTNHSYYNLSGHNTKIYDQHIQIKASNYTEIDGDIVPTGKISTVIDTDWDVTKPTRIGDNIHKLNHRGYHFNYVFDKPDGTLDHVVKVTDPNSGRTLDISTTQPGIQFYSGNSIPENINGKNGVKYGMHSGYCLETQHFPDSPNHSNFPSTLVKPNERYHEIAIYKFGIEE